MAIPVVSPTLASLRTLCIDARYSRPQSPIPSTLQSIVDFFQTSGCQLTSFCLKLPERNVMIGHAFVIKLLSTYGPSLTRVSFIDCGLENQSLSLIAKKCTQLERLDVAIPMKDMVRIHCSVLTFSLELIYGLFSIFSPRCFRPRRHSRHWSMWTTNTSMDQGLP